MQQTLFEAVEAEVDVEELDEVLKQFPLDARVYEKLTNRFVGYVVGHGVVTQGETSRCYPLVKLADEAGTVMVASPVRLTARRD